MTTRNIRNLSRSFFQVVRNNSKMERKRASSKRQKLADRPVSNVSKRQKRADRPVSNVAKVLKIEPVDALDVWFRKSGHTAGYMFQFLPTTEFMLFRLVSDSVDPVWQVAFRKLERVYLCASDNKYLTSSFDHSRKEEGINMLRRCLIQTQASCRYVQMLDMQMFLTTEECSNIREMPQLVKVEWLGTWANDDQEMHMEDTFERLNHLLPTVSTRFESLLFQDNRVENPKVNNWLEMEQLPQRRIFVDRLKQQLQKTEMKHVVLPLVCSFTLLQARGIFQTPGFAGLTRLGLTCPWIQPTTELLELICNSAKQLKVLELVQMEDNIDWQMEKDVKRVELALFQVAAKLSKLSTLNLGQHNLANDEGNITEDEINWFRWSKTVRADSKQQLENGEIEFATFSADTENVDLSLVDGMTWLQALNPLNQPWGTIQHQLIADIYSILQHDLDALAQWNNKHKCAVQHLVLKRPFLSLRQTSHTEFSAFENLSVVLKNVWKTLQLESLQFLSPSGDINLVCNFKQSSLMHGCNLLFITNHTENMSTHWFKAFATCVSGLKSYINVVAEGYDILNSERNDAKVTTPLLDWLKESKQKLEKLVITFQQHQGFRQGNLRIKADAAWKIQYPMEVFQNLSHLDMTFYVFDESVLKSLSELKSLQHVSIGVHIQKVQQPLAFFQHDQYSHLELYLYGLKYAPELTDAKRIGTFLDQHSKLVHFGYRVDHPLVTKDLQLSNVLPILSKLHSSLKVLDMDVPSPYVYASDLQQCLQYFPNLTCLSIHPADYSLKQEHYPLFEHMRQIQEPKYQEHLHTLLQQSNVWPKHLSACMILVSHDSTATSDQIKWLPSHNATTSFHGVWDKLLVFLDGDFKTSSKLAQPLASASGHFDMLQIFDHAENESLRSVWTPGQPIPNANLAATVFQTLKNAL